MAKGTGKKPDILKPSETPQVQKDVVLADTLSTIDLGHDFIKSGETPQIGRGK